MGVAHSVDSCSAGNEGKKDDLFHIPSHQDLLEYNRMEQQAAQKHHQQQQQPEKPTKSLPRPIPDVNLSVQRKLGVEQSNDDNDLHVNNLSSATSPTSPSSSFFHRQKKHHKHHNHHSDHNEYHQGGRLSSSLTRLRKKSFRKVKQAGSSVLGKVSHAAGAVGHSSRRLFQHHNNHHNNSPRTSYHNNNIGLTTTTTIIAPNVKGGVLLRGCLTDDEHKHLAREVVELLRPLHGAEALEAGGFEYRTVQLDEKGHVIIIKEEEEEHNNNGRDENEATPSLLEEVTAADHHKSDNISPEAAVPEKSRIYTSNNNEDKSRNCTCPSTEDGQPANATDGCTCQCRSGTGTMTRLFHKESGTMITPKNRKEFIADGDMYDTIARVTQEYAQDVMIRDGDLEWVTICDAGNNPEPIRALVSKRLLQDESRLDREPTLLIATGKGKVRAGVFSRQHLLLSGLECSTAVPIVREAHKRNMMMVLVDPNVHGDRLGMVTFEKSMQHLFRRWESKESHTDDNAPLSQRDLFVLSHSQSGAQLARYLLDKSKHYIPHIRAVAFTDSTHNIQWAKTKDVAGLKEFLESEDCIYFKCSKNDSNDPLLNPLSSVGTEVETDDFWKHRFGNIKTVCAGTSEHSLTNWFARCHIWEHFDQRLTNVAAASKEYLEERNGDSITLSKNTVDATKE